jgi:hypothetical protein
VLLIVSKGIREPACSAKSSLQRHPVSVLMRSGTIIIAIPNGNFIGRVERGNAVASVDIRGQYRAHLYVDVATICRAAPNYNEMPVNGSPPRKLLSNSLVSCQREIRRAHPTVHRNSLAAALRESLRTA